MQEKEIYEAISVTRLISAHRHKTDNSKTIESHGIDKRQHISFYEIRQQICIFRIPRSNV